MTPIRRPAPFVLIASNHGTMIINRNDYRMMNATQGYGVGHQMMEHSCFDQEEVDLALNILSLRRQYFGDDVVALDGGANIGVHTVEWARFMHGWGHVHAFEAQEKIFYALAGNVILNNCFNVSARHAALGATQGEITIPEPNYLIPSSFGSLELKHRANNEFIGQEINYATLQKKISMLSIDSLQLPRLDFLKIDVEGMEEDVLNGAEQTLARCKPVLLVETIKSNRAALEDILGAHGYTTYAAGINMIAIHSSDPCAQHIQST